MDIGDIKGGVWCHEASDLLTQLHMKYGLSLVDIELINQWKDAYYGNSTQNITVWQDLYTYLPGKTYKIKEKT